MNDTVRAQTYPGTTWETMTPAEAGMDEVKLEAFRDYLGSHGCVVRSGKMIYTWGSQSERDFVFSAEKPWYAHFLWKALEDGKIPSLDQKVNIWEPRLNDINADLAYKDRNITWRHFANQTSCYGVSDNPGEAFNYNDYQMALFWDALFLKVYGVTYENVDSVLLHPMLTDILQCQDNPTFMKSGHPSQGSLGVSVRDFARFGLLYLREGNWQGNQLISAEHTRTAVSSPLPAALPTSTEVLAEVIDGQRTIGRVARVQKQGPHHGSYSWLWWVNGLDHEGNRNWPDVPADTYMAIGGGGNRMAVIPSLDIVAVWLSVGEESRDVNHALKLLVEGVQSGIKLQGDRFLLNGKYCLRSSESYEAKATVFPGANWEEKSPESQNVDSQKLDDAMSYLAGECGSAGTDQAVVICNGYMIWKGSDIDNMHNVWSTSKSFTSTVLGLLIDDGKCTLDTYAGDYLSVLSSQYPGVKLRHFASMTSGYDGANHSDESACQSETPFEPTSPHFSPGSEFEYCDDAMNQFGNVLTRITGKDIKSFFKDRIADPIGMNDAKWDWADWDTIDGFVMNGGAGNKGKGIHISARELARFGLLFLNRGLWDGTRLISLSWVDQATSAQVLASVSGSDGTYGFNWWVNGSEKVRWPEAPASTFAAEGHNNNKCFVIPDWNMVIVRLGKDGNVSDSVYSTFLGKVKDALIIHALPGQVIVDPDHPQWLKYKGGGPFFMCGPGDPENFLYRGSRNPDGTRNGDQMTLINKLRGTGANCIYMQIVRSHGGDGDNTHNPFTDSDPAKGIDQDILDQWETWFNVMDENGIVIYLFFYDDGAHIWSEDTIGSGEKPFIQEIVNKFEHHKHLIWCVAEEYQEAYSVTCVKDIAKEIRLADDYNHAIAVHKLSGLSFPEFADDPNIDQFAIQVSANNAAALHNSCVTAWNNASGRYSINMAEGTNHVTGGATEIRKKSWAAAMAGAYVMVYEMFIDSTATSELLDCGRLVDFMESTEFNKMSPHDDLKFGETDYVLAKPGDCYIAYACGIAASQGTTTNLGIRNLNKGEYTLKWFDCKDGDTTIQTVNIDSSGNYLWDKPSGIGDEVAIYVKKSGGLSDNLSLITSPYPDARFSPGEEVTVTGTGDNLSWSISCINDGEDILANGSGTSITFTVPGDFTNNNIIRITLSGDGSIVEQVHAMASSGKNFYEQNGIVSMEAENYTSQEGYNLLNRTDASGNLVMQVGSEGSLNYSFTLKSEGLWYIWMRTYATASENNGLILKLDDKTLTAPADNPYAGINDIYLRKHGWCWKPEWQGPGHGNHEGPVTMTASAGKHTLSVCKRKIEDPVIDKILLTRTNSAPADSSFGPDDKQNICGWKYCSGCER